MARVICLLASSGAGTFIAVKTAAGMTKAQALSGIEQALRRLTHPAVDLDDKRPPRGGLLRESKAVLRTFFYRPYGDQLPVSGSGAGLVNAIDGFLGIGVRRAFRIISAGPFDG